MAAPRFGRGCLGGFTLVELIVVVVLLGIVASVAAPRLISTSLFDERGFADEVRAAIRYAQKVAVAQRRPVCVDVRPLLAPAPATAHVALVYAGGGVCNGAAPVNAPGSAAPLRATPPNKLGATGTDFAFNGLGQPITPAGAVLAAAQTITIANPTSGYSRVITIDPETGYVR